MKRIIAILLLFPIILTAESLQQVSAPLENRVFFKFDTYPIEASSSLSDDKKQIIIKLKDTKLDVSQNTFVGKGNISSVDLSYKDKQLTVFINMKEQAGYTIAPMKSIGMFAVETFDWSKIDKQEDLYRNSLLAYESGITDVALDDLKKSNYKNSNDILTDILLSTKSYEAAVEAAFKAYNKSNMPVHLAVLSEIAANLQDTNKSKTFINRLEKLTGINKIALNKSYKLSLSSLDNQFEKELDSLKLENSTEKNAEQEIAENRFKNIFASDSSDNKDSNALSSVLFKDFYGFPWWSEYILYFVLIAALLVVYMYLRWRNKQILALKEFSEKKRKAEERKEKAKKYHRESKEVEDEIEKGLAERKKKHQSEKDAKAESDKDENAEKSKESLKDETKKTSSTSNFSAEMLKAQQLYGKPDKAKSSPEKKDDSQSLTPPKSESSKVNREKRANKIEQIIDAIRTNSKPEVEEEVQKPKDYSGLSAKMQLAMKITEQELQEKNKQLSKLENLTDEELDKLAKELGTGKASIETKKNMQDLLSNQEAIDKLAKKFNKRE